MHNKADTLFDFSTGASPERTITNRLDNNINNFPGWTGSWTPGKPFASSFLIRNPKGKKREELFDYDEQAAPARRRCRLSGVCVPTRPIRSRATARSS